MRADQQKFQRIIMPSQLHKDMVKTCKLELNDSNTLTDDELQSIRRKGLTCSPMEEPIPDLAIEKELAVECIIIPPQQDSGDYVKSFPSRLIKLSNSYKKLILVFPVPDIDNIVELWLYKPAKSLVKFIPEEARSLRLLAEDFQHQAEMENAETEQAKVKEKVSEEEKGAERNGE